MPKHRGCPSHAVHIPHGVQRRYSLEPGDAERPGAFQELCQDASLVELGDGRELLAKIKIQPDMEEHPSMMCCMINCNSSPRKTSSQMYIWLGSAQVLKSYHEAVGHLKKTSEANTHRVHNTATRPDYAGTMPHRREQKKRWKNLVAYLEAHHACDQRRYNEVNIA